MKARKILVVDDEEDIGTLMKMILKSAGFEVVHVSSIDQAKSALKQEPFDTIFLDLNLNGQFGLYLLPHLEPKNSNAQVVVITAQKDQSILKEVRSSGIETLIEKPFTKKEILAAIES